MICARRTEITGKEKTWFYCGWFVVTVSLLSPLCPLSVALFSARVGQHMLLLLLGAPLVALGRPDTVFSSILPAQVRRLPASATAASAVFAVSLWFWHAPEPYTATFTSRVVYWMMHLTLFGSALWLWCRLFSRNTSNFVNITCASVFAALQMGLLGALITFAPRAMYQPHFLTTTSWHLTPLQDQQLGGVIMWAPGSAVFLVFAVYAFWLMMRNVQVRDIQWSQFSGSETRTIQPARRGANTGSARA
ncbi:MAG: cytochrome c oxidase assembly protein [Deltaproteobacteria bacterium]|nr:cytochrome c oxidase assembly protein [Deltaproteobacteria bacterium]